MKMVQCWVCKEIYEYKVNGEVLLECPNDGQDVKVIENKE
jgi:hypothetical protein